LLKLNKRFESIYSKDILAPLPEIVVEKSINKAVFHSKKGSKRITLPISTFDIKNQTISSKTFVQAFEAIHRSRTKKFRDHLPHEIRKSLDYVIETEVGYSLDQESTDITFEEEEIPFLLDDENQTKMIEDFLNGQELIPILTDIIKVYGDKRPDSQIREQTRNVFTKKHKKIQDQIRGILCEVNPRRLSFLKKGLRSLIAPVEKNFPGRYQGWHIFFWKREEIVAKANIEDFLKGSFDQLWKKHNRELLRIDGKTLEECRNIHEAWAKGVGAKSGPRAKRRGPPLEMTLVKISEFRELLNPISGAEVLDLTGRPLDRFVLITQKQVRSLIERC